MIVVTLFLFPDAALSLAQVLPLFSVNFTPSLIMIIAFLKAYIRVEMST